MIAAGCVDVVKNRHQAGKSWRRREGRSTSTAKEEPGLPPASPSLDQVSVPERASGSGARRLRTSAQDVSMALRAKYGSERVRGSNLERETWNAEPGTRNPEPEPGTRNLEPGTWNPEPVPSSNGLDGRRRARTRDVRAELQHTASCRPFECRMDDASRSLVLAECKGNASSTCGDSAEFQWNRRQRR